jgi:uncharacterized damage-inducible protein DinB
LSAAPFFFVETNHKTIMNIIELLLKEQAQEAVTTRKMLERVPAERFGWKPHEKSMELRQLAVHIAELPSWVAMALTTDELDFEKNPYTQPAISTTAELLDHFGKSLEEGRGQLEKATGPLLLENWTLRSGDQVYSTSTKLEVIRMSFSQVVHHRAQLGVYLRLLNIPIPGSYGPSADEMNF